MKIMLTLIVALSLNLPLPHQVNYSHPRDEILFMRDIIAEVNPALIVEDENCAVRLPWAIHRESVLHGLEWIEVFVLAWQESDFDCHAKNRRDKGGAYGPFQIRRLWQPITGDPRYRYFDPDLAASRVARVLTYYRATGRYDQLVKRRFKNPLLCLYNSGEPNRVNYRYCKKIGRKLTAVRKAWNSYRGETLVALNHSPGKSHRNY